MFLENGGFDTPRHDHAGLLNHRRKASDERVEI
jgi:hypothetical protein